VEERHDNHMLSEVFLSTATSTEMLISSQNLVLQNLLWQTPRRDYQDGVEGLGYRWRSTICGARILSVSLWRWRCHRGCFLFSYLKVSWRRPSLHTIWTPQERLHDRQTAMKKHIKVVVIEDP